MPKYQKEPRDKYYPYKDLDKNGVIIVTDFTTLESVDLTEVLFFNISGMFNGKGLPEPDPDKSVTFDMNNKVGKPLIPEDLDFVINHIEQLYKGEINSLCLRSVPGLSYDSIAGFDVIKEGAIQWECSDFDKIIGHLRMLYDSILTKQ